MELEFKFAERADIIRDGGSFLCVLRGCDEQQYVLLFQVVLNKIGFEINQKLGPVSYMRPKVFLNTIDSEDNATRISWKEASKILHSVECAVSPKRFMEMQRVAKEYAK